ncbi:MAG: CapA family protein [Longimicrobiales bacterium]|nr:CapA family protein [Longimicrobiales bacterium]
MRTLLKAGAIAGALASTLAPAAAQQAAVNDGGFTMAVMGDAIITRRLTPYREPEFLRLMDLIRGADAAFANLEMLFHDYEGWPMHESGGTYMRAEPALVRELVWAGVDIVGMANNHTGDYSPEAHRLTRRYAEEAGLVTAGTGENLYEAREARFLETNDGRVALISVASTFTAHSAAGKPRGAVRGRPGLSPLRHDERRMLPREAFEKLRTSLREIGQNVPAQGERMNVFGTPIFVGDSAGTRTTPNAEDMAEIAAVVRSAATLSDYVVVSMHGHESGGNSSIPAEFLVSFAHAVIDAGADLLVGHGPHVLRGIEIYKGKPIFYSLGDFIFENETLLRLPAENYATYRLGDTAQVADFNAARYSNDTRGFPVNREIWESVVAVPTWQGEELRSIELHPITLGFGKAQAVRGRPMLADEELGKKIIDDLIARSRPFGTTIEWRDGIGVVRVDSSR